MASRMLSGTSTTSSVYTALVCARSHASSAPRIEIATTKARPRLNHQASTTPATSAAYGPALRSPESESGSGQPVRTAIAAAARIAAESSSSLEGEGVAQVADVGAHSGQRLEAEAARDELEDRGRVVEGLVDVPLARERRDDDRGDARARPPAVAPARPLRRRHVVPEAAVLVVGNDDGHPLPLGRFLQFQQEIIQVLVAARHVRIARMLVQPAHRLVERDLRQRALVDGGGEVVVVLEVLLAVRLARREALVVVERLVVRLEGERARAVRVDHRALLARILAPVARGL